MLPTAARDWDRLSAEEETLKIEILYFSGCPNHLPAVGRVRDALETEGLPMDLEEVEVRDVATAERLGFLGSPTVRINGLDVETTARSSSAVGLTCRTYLYKKKRVGLPPVEWIRAAVRE